MTGKKTAALVAGLAAAAVAAAGLLLLLSGPPGRGKPPPAAAPAPPGGAAAEGARPSSAGAAPDDEARIATLLAERSATARLELVSLYTAWSRDRNKDHHRRTLIHQVVAREEPLTAINMLALAVAGDPTPLEADEMVAEAARAVAPLWKDDAGFAQGRDMLRLADHDKTRALFAASLTERANRPPTGMAAIEDKERQELASDLIQVNMHTANRALRAQTLENVGTIAGPEVAEVLADPANAHNSAAARRAEQASRGEGPPLAR